MGEQEHIDGWIRMETEWKLVYFHRKVQKPCLEVLALAALCCVSTSGLDGVEEEAEAQPRIFDGGNCLST